MLLTSGLGLYVGIEGVQAFCQQLRDIPTVSIQMRLPGIPSILIDNYRGMRDVVEHLIDVHGYRRLAFLRGPITHRGARERYRAYVETLEDRGIPLDPTLVTPPSESWDNRVGIARFLAGFGAPLNDRVDAIVGTSAALARQALAWLRAEGVQVPEQVALTGFDDFAYLGGMIPPLTTTHVPFEEVGRHAVALLLQQMQGDAVPSQVDVLVRMVVRQSCGCPSESVVRAGLQQTGGRLQQTGGCLQQTGGAANRQVGESAHGEEKAQQGRDVARMALGPCAALRANRDAAIAEIAGLVAAHCDSPIRAGAPEDLTPPWVGSLVDALVEDLQ